MKLCQNMKIASKKQDISFINVELNFISAKFIFISAKLNFICAKFIFISAKLNFICVKLNFIFAKLIFIFHRPYFTNVHKTKSHLVKEKLDAERPFIPKEN